MNDDELTNFHRLKAILVNAYEKCGIMEVALVGGGRIVGEPARHNDYVQHQRNVHAEAERLARAVIRSERGPY